MKDHGRNIDSGATLLELITAMSILLVILLMLSTALDASLGQFRHSTDLTVKRTSARAALQWLQQDLETITLPQPARVAPLPSSVTSEQREFFSDRYIYPTEINRSSHSGDLESLPNAAPEFDQFCFVSQIPETLLLDPASNAAAGNPASAPSIVGYYVAFTRNSPLKGDTLASMKLFRHFRPGKAIDGGRYASGFLQYCHEEINDTVDPSRNLSEPNPAAIRRGIFSNSELPSLLGMRLPDGLASDPVETQAAWPVFPLAEYLKKPPAALNPNRGSPKDWTDPEHPVHDTIFPDESLCRNVVRFEIEAEKRVETGNNIYETLKATELNDHLGLNNGDEWPCLVVPDYINITIAVVNEGTARTLTRYEDWIVDWSETNASDWSESRKKIERGLQTFTLRVRVGRTTT